jgi:endonuclease/exonuclease/phosphatase family metal-dependent hydrolase
MNIINKNKIFYHATNLDNFKLVNNRHIWLSENSNYCKYLLDLYVNMLSKVIPSANDNIYIIKNTKNLNIIEVENELVLNKLIENKYYLYRYCKFKNIDGFYTKIGNHGRGSVYLLYIRKNQDFHISKLEINKYPDDINLYLKIYTLFYSLITNIIFYINYYLKFKNTTVYRHLEDDIKNTNINFLKSVKDNYTKDFQKKRYNFRININLPKPKNLRICTYNLFNYNFPLINGFDDTINDTIHFINNLNVDILCLQESYSFDNNLNNICINCNYNYNYSKWNTSVLSKYKSIFKFKRIPYSGIFDLYRYMVIQYIKDFDIWIFNIHLDPYDKTGNIRKKQIIYILNIINKMSNFKRSILLGDFNTLNLKDYSNEKLDYMYKYEPEFLSYNDFGDIPKYFIDSLSIHNIINPETSIYKKRVDYIFISKDLPFNNSYIIPFSTSDHFPVIIDL